MRTDRRQEIGGEVVRLSPVYIYPAGYLVIGTVISKADVALFEITHQEEAA